MRSHVLGFALVASLVPTLAAAQVYLLPTADPRVNAAGESWQVNGDAIFYKGDFYYPTGPTEFFDGKIMVRTGTHEGVPLYENSTLLPYETVYVPVAGNLMKPYERKRRGRLSGSTGSRVPSFAVQPWSHEAEQLAMVQDGHERYNARLSSGRAQWAWPAPAVERAEPPALAAVPGRGATTVPTGVIRTLPQRESTNAGAFVLFDGARYYSSGRVVLPNAERFSRIGDHRGAGIYRELKGDERTVFVESVPDGPLAPYTRK